MTEAEWFVTRRPLSMLDAVARDLSVRQQRAIGAAAWRLLPTNVLTPHLSRWLDTADALVERPAVKVTASTIRRGRLRFSLFGHNHENPAAERGHAALYQLLVGNVRPTLVNVGIGRGSCDTRDYDVVDPEVAEIIRDIVGNPFRPVTFSPAWRTTTAVQLARQMYESREFSLLPILADALQDAGCETPDVLDHCRAPNGVHVRGCWVVDLVLGKT